MTYAFTKDLPTTHAVTRMRPRNSPLAGTQFTSLKGEFEAEGLTREEVGLEALYASRRGLDYLVKIGGCEARSDVNFLQRMGITSVVAPMIESGFAMEKYMETLPDGHFHHIGVTIETVGAVERIEEILDAGINLTNVTIGRSDLTASYRGSDVDSYETMAMVRTVARAAQARGLEVTMGGGVNVKTRQLLEEDHELSVLIACVETRKVVIPVSSFIAPGTLEAAIQIELELLELRAAATEETMAKTSNRIVQIRSRI